MDHLDVCIPLNRAPILGEGGGLQIIELARLVAEVIGYQARIVLDPSYPDGTPQKLLDASRITALGWQAQTPLPEWVKKTCVIGFAAALGWGLVKQSLSDESCDGQEAR